MRTSAALDRAVQVAGEADPSTGGPGHVAGELHAGLAEAAEVDGPVVGAAGELHGRLTSCRHGVGHLIDRAVEVADLLEPPVDVHAAVRAGEPVVAADGQHDVPAGPGARGRASRS